jgi:hypothetical protein
MAGRFETGKIGYRIIEKNYLCRPGKLDLVAEEDDDVVFLWKCATCESPILESLRLQ